VGLLRLKLAFKGGEYEFKRIRGARRDDYVPCLRFHRDDLDHGGFIWWLNYSYKKRNKKHQKPHLELVSPSSKLHGQRRHKRHKK
jgi:hypothetical protein